MGDFEGEECGTRLRYANVNPESVMAHMEDQCDQPAPVHLIWATEQYTRESDYREVESVVVHRWVCEFHLKEELDLLGEIPGGVQVIHPDDEEVEA